MTIRILTIIRCGVVLALTACAPFPVVDASVSRARADAPAPDLLPIDDLLARAGSTASPVADDAGLDGRVAALKARAAALRRPITDPATRARLGRAIPVPPRSVASATPSG